MTATQRPVAAQLVATTAQLDAALVRANHLERQVGDTTAAIGTADQYLDDVQNRLAQWVADGGVVDTGLLSEVLADVIVARRLLETAALRAVQA